VEHPAAAGQPVGPPTDRQVPHPYVYMYICYMYLYVSICIYASICIYMYLYVSIFIYMNLYVSNPLLPVTSVTSIRYVRYVRYIVVSRPTRSTAPPSTPSSSPTWLTCWGSGISACWLGLSSYLVTPTDPSNCLFIPPILISLLSSPFAMYCLFPPFNHPLIYPSL
jgi:hypothetical protein